MRAPPPQLWRRFVADLLVTTAAGIFLGVVYLLYDRASLGTGPLASLAAYRIYVRAAFGVVVGLLFMRAVGRLVSGYLHVHGDQRHEAVVRLFFNLLVGVVVVFYIALVAGVNLQNVFLGSALAGVVLGLASQTVLGNVFAGITIVLWGPFRTGDRIGVISASYGALAPSYPHETLYPSYVGRVTDVGLLYTVLALENGRIARLPNSVLLQALVVNLSQSPVRALRIRMTFPLTVPVAAAESAVAELPGVPGLLAEGRAAPVLEVADLAPTSWDALVTVWANDPDEDRVRDLVLRGILSRTGLGAPGPPPKA